MAGELTTVGERIAAMVEDLLELAMSLNEDELNRAPDVAGANSPYVIVTHVLGNVRAWVLGIVCEQPTGRDRSSEFRAYGSSADLANGARALIDDCAAALQQLDPSRLDDEITPRQELFGEGATHPMTRREALLHPLEHAAIHVGQLQLTADLLRRDATPS